MTSLTYDAPAKINLHLRVAPPDASGFHPLRSWMVTIGLHDTITASVADAGSRGITLDVEGQPALAPDPSNLVYRAAAALKPERPIALRLRKRVPMGAGLGGGSADAAATLVVVNDLLDLGRSRMELHAIASTLGSDVPFFLDAPAAIATGRGEQLMPCDPPRRARYALLILPPYGVSTPAAYRSLDAIRPVAPPGVLDAFDVAAWAQLPASELLTRLVNDLEPAAFAIEPRLGVFRGAVEALLGRPVRMSGSGSTLFTLFDDPEQAESAAARLREGPADAAHAITVPIATQQIRPIGGDHG